MTRKTRRSPTDDPPTVKAGRENAGGENAGGEKTKVSLPAFGFAEDLLAKTPPGAGPAAAGDGEPAADADPRRIFRFADSLEQASAEAAAKVPVRLETWVAFSLAGEVYALPVEPVREVVRVASITRVPHAPRPIRGVTNMRGRVIPVIDLRLRIELPETDLGRGSRVMVVGSRGRLLGLLVDAVHQVIHIDRARIQPPPADVMTVRSDYLTGVYHLEDQLILLLDLDRALIIRDPAAAPETTTAARAGGGGAGAEDAPAGAA